MNEIFGEALEFDVKNNSLSRWCHIVTRRQCLIHAINYSPLFGHGEWGIISMIFALCHVMTTTRCTLVSARVRINHFIYHVDCVRGIFPRHGLALRGIRNNWKR